jgi:hypothetical protein
VPYGLIHNRGPNLGDDIQSCAARQFLPRIDYLIDREKISQSHVSAATKVILNGWYMHHVRFWPPSPQLHPLFISFHAKEETPASMAALACDLVLGSPARRDLVSPDLKAYYQPFGPVGCRDTATQDRFRRIGVEAYFSGCLTLTLPPPAGEPGKSIIFTDPFGILPGTCFRADLWARLPRSLRRNALKISHLTHLRSYQDRLQRTQHILKLYAHAPLVITSRLHAALPCIAFGTPVIFLHVPHRVSRFSGYESILRPVSIPSFLHEARHGDIMSLVSTPDRDRVTSLATSMQQKCADFIAQP